MKGTKIERKSGGNRERSRLRLCSCGFSDSKGYYNMVK